MLECSALLVGPGKGSAGNMGYRHPTWRGEASREAAIRRSWPTVAAVFSGGLHGTRLRRDGQGPDGGEQRFPREQQDQAPVPAEPATSPFLGRDREPLGSPARLGRRIAPDRQERYRQRAGRPPVARP